MSRFDSCKCIDNSARHRNVWLFWQIFGHWPECDQFELDMDRLVDEFEKRVRYTVKVRTDDRIRDLKRKFRFIRKADEKLTETTVQRALFEFCSLKNHGPIVPNFTAFASGEMDTCSVLKSGLVNEYEIKLTKSDFRADLKKPKHKRLGNAANRAEALPNYFWYVAPVGMINVVELPRYAGLLEFKPTIPIRGFEVTKKASQLHKRKIPDAMIKRIAVSLMYRVWK